MVEVPSFAPGRHAFCYILAQQMGARSLSAQVLRSVRTAIRESFPTGVPFRSRERRALTNNRAFTGRGR
jgi:hypothetical protein